MPAQNIVKTAQGHTEAGPQFKFSSERLEKPWFETRIPGLQGK